MKKQGLLFTLYCALAILAFAALPSTTLANENYRLYSSTQWGFEICYPESWSMQEGFMGSAVSFASPYPYKGLEFPAGLNVMVQDLSTQPYPLDLETYTELSKRQIETILTDPKIISVREAFLGGLPGKEMIYKGSMGKLRLQYMCRYAIVNKKVYLVTFGTDPKSFPELKSLGTDLMDSFDFI